ncbi:MAG: CPBP family intramembrane metalloprotease [Ignavibacteria bacterium]|nr:CPBP family intramembrane metalloprotease [Ignavibacteria bacterium]
MIQFERKLDKYTISPIAAGFLVLIVAFFLYQVIGGALTLLFAGSEVTTENAGMIRLLTSISQILFLLVVSILFARLIYDDFNSVFKISKPDWKELVISFIGLILIISASQSYLFLQTNFIKYLSTQNESLKSFFDALNNFNSVVEESYIKIIKSNNGFDYASIVLSIALVPAFCEEFLFRGFVQSSFEQKMKPIWAIILTGVLFGIFHFNPYALLPLIALGAYFSYLVYITQSIFIPVFLHFLNNFITVTVYYFTQSDEILKTQAEVDLSNTLLLASFFSMIFLFILTIVILNKMIKIKILKQRELDNAHLS